MATETTDGSERSGLSIRVRAIYRSVRTSILLMIALSGLFLFAFSGIVLTAMNKDVLAGLLGVSGVIIFLIGLVGYGIYRVLSTYF